MRKQIVTVVLAGAVGLGGAAALAPVAATAQDSTASPSPATAVAERVARLKEALAGLVTDRTLTQAQADRVATTLAERLPGRGGHGHGPRGGRVSPEATASALGISVEQLRTARAAGKTLVQIAQEQGISRADLVRKLVAAARTQLAADVEAGRLTQAQADALSATLTERITQEVDRVGRGRGRGGPGGPTGS